MKNKRIVYSVNNKKVIPIYLNSPRKNVESFFVKNNVVYLQKKGGLIMQTKEKETLGRSSTKKNVDTVKKSKIALFWEKNPKGIIEVYDRKAVNR